MRWVSGSGSASLRVASGTALVRRTAGVAEGCYYRRARQLTRARSVWLEPGADPPGSPQPPRRPPSEGAGQLAEAGESRVGLASIDSVSMCFDICV